MRFLFRATLVYSMIGVVIALLLWGINGFAVGMLPECGLCVLIWPIYLLVVYVLARAG